MPILVKPEDIANIDRKLTPFVASRGLPDGSILLYQKGEIIPLVAYDNSPDVDFKSLLSKLSDSEIKLWNGSVGTNSGAYLLKFQSLGAVQSSDPFLLDLLNALVIDRVLSAARADEILRIVQTPK